MIHTFPLKLENMGFRSHGVIGIHELNGKIVYVQGALGVVLQETPDNKTAFSKLVIADSFSPDFAVHSQMHVSYKNQQGVFYANTHAESYVEEGRLFLNTYKTFSPSPKCTIIYAPSEVSEDVKNHLLGFGMDVFKKLFEITDSEIREVLPFPEPKEKVFNSKKTYRFGDFVLRMASEMKLECRSAKTDAVLWVMRLTSYLYTELEVKNGILFFGTAGKGGHFYGVSLTDGRMIFDWNTGETTKIVWGNDCVIITDRKGDLVLINPTDGTEIRRFRFKKMVASTSYPFLVHGSNVYTVLRDKKDWSVLYAVCVET